jgi:hypothetical protein
LRNVFHEKANSIKKLFDPVSIQFPDRKDKKFGITVNKEFMEKNKDIFRKLHEIRYTSDIGEDKTEVQTSWSNKSNWILQTANELLNIINKEKQTLKLHFTQSYISLVDINTFEHIYSFHKRGEPDSRLFFKEKNDEKAETIKELFGTSSIQFTFYKDKAFGITVDKDFVKKHKDIFSKIHNIRFSSDGEILDE